MNTLTQRTMVLAAALFAGALVLAPASAYAHCDTLDGPVIADAKAALGRGDVTPVLKWVTAENEAEVRAAFARVLAVRGLGKDTQGLADTYFFETLVRLHRAGEGAPFTGLKPAVADLGPTVREADEALEKGSVDALVGLVTRDVAAGIRERFARAAEARKHRDESVQAGRAYVRAYVEYVHYVERLHTDATGPGGHAEEPAAEPAHEHHHP